MRKDMQAIVKRYTITIKANCMTKLVS